jgi:hypothetical protein
MSAKATRQVLRCEACFFAFLGGLPLVESFLALVHFADLFIVIIVLYMLAP